jgi:IS30 family transposase
MKPFQPSRMDGRSDRVVVYEFVRDAEPDALFAFDDLRTELEQGVDSEITNRRISSAVATANKTLLSERQRYLVTIRGFGYRMIRSSEHLPVAMGRKQKAETQIRHGIEILRNTEMSDLSTEQRSRHGGMLLILDGFYRMTKASEKRLERHEQVLDEIRQQQSAIDQRLSNLEREAS